MGTRGTRYLLDWLIGLFNILGFRDLGNRGMNDLEIWGKGKMKRDVSNEGDIFHQPQLYPPSEVQSEVSDSKPIIEERRRRKNSKKFLRLLPIRYCLCQGLDKLCSFSI